MARVPSHAILARIWISHDYLRCLLSIGPTITIAFRILATVAKPWALVPPPSGDGSYDSSGWAAVSSRFHSSIDNEYHFMAHMQTTIRRSWHLLVLILFASLGPSTASAQVDEIDELDELPQYLPGVIAEVHSEGRTLRQLAEDVWLDETPERKSDGANLQETTPGLQALNREQPSVKWSGYLWARENGPFQLELFAAGRVKVSLTGKSLLDAQSDQPGWLACEPIELSFGYHQLEIEFEPTVAPARLSAYWSGPSFSLEPIGSQYLFHAADDTPDNSWKVGQLLNRGLRCAACHRSADSNPQQTNPASASLEQIFPAPALTHLRDNLHPEWLVQQLTQPAPEASTELARTASHLPTYQLDVSDAQDIVAALWQASLTSPELESLEAQLGEANRTRNKKSDALRTVGDTAQGELAFVSIGCLACHQVGELGRPSGLSEHMFGGGSLTNIAEKRPDNFFRQWLSDPARVNEDHRMPQFELSLLEQLDLATYLGSLGSASATEPTSTPEEPGEPQQSRGDAAHGARLIAELRCSACHQLPVSLGGALVKTPLNSDSEWDQGCLSDANPAERRPGFGLSSSQRNALREYWNAALPWTHRSHSGEALLQENNCIACHARGAQPGIKRQLSEIVAAVPALAPRLAALAPPSLTAVGDKLHGQALQAAVTRRAPLLRPWLDVRMPRFGFSESQLNSLTNSLIAHDRIPPRADETDNLAESENSLSKAANQLAATRLVTAEGFGCQSCHAIGAIESPKVDLNARGTNLAMLGERVRPSWFQRWVRNPARIVPRMEMPAIQTPVRGVLHDSLSLQLDALWSTLNTPGFTPPQPGPVRVIRNHNHPEIIDRTWLLTDVLEADDNAFIRPLVFGLPNRHNFLFDLEAGELKTWWLGDTAYQYTRGKTWFWAPGGVLLTEPKQVLERIRIVDNAGRVWEPTPSGQIAVHYDGSLHRDGAMEWYGRLHMTPVDRDDPADAEDPGRWVGIRQTFRAAFFGEDATSQISTQLSGLQPGDRVQCSSSARATGPAIHLSDSSHLELELGQTQLGITTQGEITLIDASQWELVPKLPVGDEEHGTVQWHSSYRALVPTDQFPQTAMPELIVKPQAINAVPGYDGIQLPLPPSEMPISFAWNETGECFVGSLKGRVLKLVDADRDGLADGYELISDELPTPYGLWAGSEGVDALAKFGLIRLTPPQLRRPGGLYDATMVADGWGSSADYHDWAVGLERDAAGNYYMALPCQQDDRSAAAAYLRGTALKLIPLDGTQDARRYRIETIAAGLRFPMGLALSPKGELFASDNQGNYNPFNELNHLQPGKRYGFINKLENKDGFSPPFESPAINLPHPWTRSVNGLCFLTSPKTLQLDAPRFGPFEGHLVGCEMNGRFLVRMSLQKVGDNYQGGAYLFSRPPTELSPDATSSEQTDFEGPIVCEVSPDGELYVGNLHDSGWGGGQNTGSIVRLCPTGDLPLGIAEVRATPRGFEIDFTQAVDAEKATQASNYQLRSYQRVSTPAYGGDDQDQRNESIQSVRLSEDLRRVTLELKALRAGFVYELNVAPLGADSTAMFPSQAHYSMRSVPAEE